MSEMESMREKLELELELTLVGEGVKAMAHASSSFFFEVDAEFKLQNESLNTSCQSERDRKVISTWTLKNMVFP